MSNRFVSGGTIGTASEGDSSSQQHDKQPLAASHQSTATGSGSNNSNRNAEWEKAQAQLEAERRQREEARIKAGSGEEQPSSLYDVLQANKAAKQAAFEEANKIKNQFRALDDDEIDFLDEVVQRQKREEEGKRREMEEGLRMFREARKGDGERRDGENVAERDDEGVEEWAVGGRKRKRSAPEKGGLVRRKVDKKKEGEVEDEEKKKRREEDERKGEKVEVQKEKPKGNLGLVDYGSDSDDDDGDDE